MSRGDSHNRRAIPPIGPLQDPRVHQEVEHDAEGDGAHLHDNDHQYWRHVQEEAWQATKEQSHRGDYHFKF